MRPWAALAIAAALAACVREDMPDAYEGAQVYDENCAICHGASGQGDGDIAAGMSPKPSDLTALTRNNGGAFPVADVLSQIDGYTRSPQAGADMPEFGLLLEGPLVPVETGDGVMTPTPRPLAALLAYLESIQR